MLYYVFNDNMLKFIKSFIIYSLIISTLLAILTVSGYFLYKTYVVIDTQETLIKITKKYSSGDEVDVEKIFTTIDKLKLNIEVDLQLYGTDDTSSHIFTYKQYKNYYYVVYIDEKVYLEKCNEKIPNAVLDTEFIEVIKHYCST